MPQQLLGASTPTVQPASMQAQIDEIKAILTQQRNTKGQPHNSKKTKGIQKPGGKQPYGEVVYTYLLCALSEGNTTKAVPRHASRGEIQWQSRVVVASSSYVARTAGNEASDTRHAAASTKQQMESLLDSGSA